MTTLRTRQPTGRVPWPLILVEGGEKAGKSWACAELSASPRVGPTYWLDLGEGSGDEYGAVPGARYVIIDHDGSWSDILGQAEAVRDEARRAADAGEPPVVLVIDTGTAVWDMLKAWVDQRARRYDFNKKALAKDPDAELVIPMNLWNDANGRWRKLMTLLMTFPGIAVVTARGKEVAALDGNGRPIKNTKEYKVEGQKNMAFDCTAWVRYSRDGHPMIVGARSVHAGVRPGVDEPARFKGLTLDWLIFDHLKCDPTTAHVRDLVEGKPERTPEQIRDEALDESRTAEQLRADYTEARRQRSLGVLVPDEHGQDEALGALLIRLGKARAAAADPARLRMLQLFTEADITVEHDQVSYADDFAAGKRGVSSLAELTDDEVTTVLGLLESYIRQNTPPEAETPGQLAHEQLDQRDLAGATS
ncbi:MAG: AAA family ATPase [Actinoplanes sp.]